VDSPVVDQVDLDDLVAGGLEEVGEGHSEDVVADVAEVLGFVGVGGRELEDHALAFGNVRAAVVAAALEHLAADGLEECRAVEEDVQVRPRGGGSQEGGRQFDCLGQARRDLGRRPTQHSGQGKAPETQFADRQVGRGLEADGHVRQVRRPEDPGDGFLECGAESLV